MRKLERYVGYLNRNIRGMQRRVEDEKVLNAYVKQVQTLIGNLEKGDFKLVRKTLGRMRPEVRHEIRYTVAAILRHTKQDPEASIKTV
jgi:hypothetical protein